MQPVGTVAQLWRFPVKSMAGESLERADVIPTGVIGDRLWAVRDEEKKCVTGGKRIPALMTCRARFLSEPAPDAMGDRVPPVAIALPDGTELSSDRPDVHARLSDFLGRAVTLCPRRRADERAHYRAPRATKADFRQQFGLGPNEPIPDFSMFPTAVLIQLSRYATPPGSYFDAYELHILTTASLAELARRAPAADFAPLRFRPNLLVDTGTGTATGFAEADWCGGTLSAGELRSRIEIPTVRCSMTMRPQPGLAADPGVLAGLVEHAQRLAGVYARVERPGVVRLGDPVAVETAGRARVGGWVKASARSIRRLALRASAAVMPDE